VTEATNTTVTGSRIPDRSRCPGHRMPVLRCRRDLDQSVWYAPNLSWHAARSSHDPGGRPEVYRRVRRSLSGRTGEDVSSSSPSRHRDHRDCWSRKKKPSKWHTPNTARGRALLLTGQVQVPGGGAMDSTTAGEGGCRSRVPSYGRAGQVDRLDVLGRSSAARNAKTLRPRQNLGHQAGPMTPGRTRG